jgi:ABC-type multidrug transport system ATPase subunit
MDPEGTREILSFLREKVKNDGLTVFRSSHLLYEVEEYCDKVFVINHGRLIASGKVKEILAPHDNIVQVTFAGTVPKPESLVGEEKIKHVEILSNDTLEIILTTKDSAWLNSFLLGRGYRVSGFTPKQKTLKEFFLSVTEEDK